MVDLVTGDLVSNGLRTMQHDNTVITQANAYRRLSLLEGVGTLRSAVCKVGTAETLDCELSDAARRGHVAMKLHDWRNGNL